MQAIILAVLLLASLAGLAIVVIALAREAIRELRGERR